MTFDTRVPLNRILDSQGDGSGTFQQNVQGISISGATNATPVVCTSVAHGYENGDFINVQSMTGLTSPNGIRVVANKSDDIFEITDTAGVDIAGNGTYGGSPTAHLCFLAKPAAAQILEVHRMNVVCGNNAAVAQEEYVGETKLTTGITVETRNVAGIIATLTATPVRCWNDWGLNAGVDNPLLDLTGNTTDAVARWSFDKYAPPIILQGNLGEFLILVVSDDLNALTYHRSCIQGSAVT